jgi:dTDP-3-amino-2,3,6-trideoxy-4-keto-D-glucose/dTDP-3-amino-3,4,6-trideoxy-alpha-D-glucose/dTDP-2,6-dideoxy-D-kanosamine transaminase
MAADIKEAMYAVFDSGVFLKGPRTREFEERWAAYCGTSHCLAVANGTDALELALRAIGAAGQEVIVASNAGGYSTTACRLVGAVPVYADIDRASHLIDTDAAMAMLSANTRAIVATHLYGNLVDVLALKAGLEERGRSDILIIEDCAQAHGLTSADGPVGSLGDVGTFSFYPTKNLGALGDGGALTTSDGALFEELKALHQYGWVTRYQSERAYGRNSRLDEIQAAVLLIKMRELDRWNAERCALIDRYRQALPTLHFVTGAVSTVAHLCVAEVEERDEFRMMLKARGVSTDVHYPVLDPDQPSQIGLESRCDSLAASRTVVDRIVTLPCFPGMTEDELVAVIETTAMALTL